jgi:hypothetical protein
LQDRGQRQAGWGYWRVTLGTLLIERRQFLLKGVGKQCVTMVPQKHKQLGTTNALDDGAFSHR